MLEKTKVEERTTKKRRLSAPRDESSNPKETLKTSGQSVGALIGRKRKERKAGKSGK
jgi:hypothetical protein